jgi:transposase
MKLGTRLVEERLRALAERGCSYSEAAAELGVGYHYVAAFAKRHGVSFKLQPRGPKLRVDSDARENEMRSLYLNGETLQQIGEKFGVTRERVRQILTRRFGMTAISGGQSQKTRLRAKIDKDKVDARCRKAFGCSYAVYKRLLKRTDKPTYAYGQQRKNAKFRGIDWEITFYDWWKVWEQSGHWEERGRGGGYCMCRLNDTGPYAIDNVYIATGRENMRDYWVGRRNLQAEISA